jgi:hypothetical protein
MYYFVILYFTEGQGEHMSFIVAIIPTRFLVSSGVIIYSPLCNVKHSETFAIITG